MQNSLAGRDCSHGQDLVAAEQLELLFLGHEQRQNQYQSGTFRTSSGESPSNLLIDVDKSGPAIYFRNNDKKHQISIACQTSRTVLQGCLPYIAPCKAINLLPRGSISSSHATLISAFVVIQMRANRVLERPVPIFGYGVAKYKRQCSQSTSWYSGYVVLGYRSPEAADNEVFWELWHRNVLHAIYVREKQIDTRLFREGMIVRNILSRSTDVDCVANGDFADWRSSHGDSSQEAVNRIDLRIPRGRKLRVSIDKRSMRDISREVAWQTMVWCPFCWRHISSASGAMETGAVGVLIIWKHIHLETL
jgi:hypothetical protein